MAKEIRESRPEIDGVRAIEAELREGGRDCQRAGTDRNRPGLDSCGTIATRTRILREDGHAGPAPAGERPRHFQRNREIPRDKTRLAPEGGTPLKVRGKQSLD